MVKPMLGPTNVGAATPPNARASRAAMWLAFLQGVLAAMVVTSSCSARWEDNAVDRIVAIAEAEAIGASDEDRAVRLMNFVHRLLQPRWVELGSKGVGPFRPPPLNSIDSQLIVPAGACGSFAQVLARCLQRAGYDVRLAQMLARGIWGDHIVVEAFIDGRWVVMDPFYDLAFRGSDGKLLTFEEVRSGWQRLRLQCPPTYRGEYCYEDVRYTNWRGLPVESLGLGIEEMSVRSYMLNIHWWIAASCGLASVMVVALQWRRRSVTSSNG